MKLLRTKVEMETLARHRLQAVAGDRQKGRKQQHARLVTEE